MALTWLISLAYSLIPSFLTPEFIVEHVQQYVPTWLLRLGVRLYLRHVSGPAMRGGDVVCQQIVTDTKERDLEPVTTMVEEANEQHYGNDPAFFAAHLGPRLKYSACEFGAVGDASVVSLGDAEDRTIRIYQDRAGLAELPDGARVLELGCGWGSLSLANAARFPGLQFVSFSNSPQQIEFIGARAKERGLQNLQCFVEDYALFVDPKASRVPAGPYDAAIAIETIEHCRNIRQLLAAVAGRLKPGGRLFAQSLLHQSASYLCDAGDWMGRNFFSGGSILSLNSYFHLTPPSLRLESVTPVSGVGYSRTLHAWLVNLEAQRPLLVAKYGKKFYEGFRAFYFVCVEAFAANDGCEFMVGYYSWTKV